MFYKTIHKIFSFLPRGRGANRVRDKELLTNRQITLVMCPCWGIQMPYLGQAYLSQFIKNLGADVYTLDLNISVYRRVSERYRYLWENRFSQQWVDPKSMRELIHNELAGQVDSCTKAVLQTPSHIIGFSVYQSNRLFSIRVIDEIKKQDPSRVIIVGGRGCGTESERSLFNKDMVYAFVIGEGEEILAEGLSRNGDFSNIPGVIIPEISCRPETVKPKPIDVNSMPFPTFSEFDLNNYTEKTLPVISSRGCIGKCAFCDDHLSSGKYRYRKAESVVQELRWHVKRNKITHFWFNDLLINGNNGNLERLCDLIIKKKMKIRWIALAIIRRDTTLKLLNKMRKAGCYTINYGIESGSDSILKKMGALYTVKDAERILKLTRKAMINTQLNFIVGFPGETESEFIETLEFIERNREWICGITNLNTCTIVENSPLGKKPDIFGAMPEPGWEPVDGRFSTVDGTNYEERVERLNRATVFIKTLGLSIWTKNMPSTESSQKIS